MKTLYKNIWMLSALLIMSVSFSSCMDEDERIGYTISGHWFGDMDMYYNGEPSRGSELEFYNTGWGYNRGSGVEIDYYAYHAITSYFNWEVKNSVLYLTFDDPSLDCAIVDYTLGYDYFRGYIADYYTLENLTYFSLRNYDRYWEQYGYGGYEYYYVKGSRAEQDSTVVDSTYHGVRGVNMK